VLFLQLSGKRQGITRKGGARPTLFQNFCVVLYIVCFVSFCVLFVCKCVLYVLLPPGVNQIAADKYIIPNVHSRDHKSPPLVFSLSHAIETTSSHVVIFNEVSDPRLLLPIFFHSSHPIIILYPSPVSLY
jgi:hypothetical protein